MVDGSKESQYIRHSIKTKIAKFIKIQMQNIVQTYISNASSPDPQQPMAVNVENGGS